MDQGSSGGQWVSLGSYAFTAGIDKSITLSNQPSSEASSAAEQRAQAKLTSVRGAEARRRRVSCSLQVSNKPWRPELEELKSDGVAETYFPDQPLKVTMRWLVPGYITIEVDGGDYKSADAVEEELFTVMRQEGIRFSKR